MRKVSGGEAVASGGEARAHGRAGAQLQLKGGADESVPVWWGVPGGQVSPEPGSAQLWGAEVGGYRAGVSGLRVQDGTLSGFPAGVVEVVRPGLR